MNIFCEDAIRIASCDADLFCGFDSLAAGLNFKSQTIFVFNFTRNNLAIILSKVRLACDLSDVFHKNKFYFQRITR